MRIACFAHVFPALSQTFVLDGIVWNIRHGHQVDIFATTSASGEPLHESVVELGLAQTVRHYEPRSLGPIRRTALAGLKLALHAPLQPQRTWARLHLLTSGQLGALRALFASFVLPEPAVYDVIHAHFGASGAVAVALRDAGLLHGPLITTFHGYDISQISPGRARALYAGLFQRGELFTVNSAFSGQRLRELGCPETRLQVRPTPIPLDRFKFKARTLLPAETPVLLSVGRLVEVKGITHAIAACDLLRRTHSRFEYWIVGDGPLRIELEQQVRELGLTSHVHFLGATTQSELAAVADKAHLLVFPSCTTREGQWESLGRVVQEAQAMGMPVVATRHGGVPEGLLDGKSGFLVPEKDPQALADALRRLLDAPHTWAALGNAGRAFVEEHFDEERTNAWFLEQYRALSKSQ